MTLRELIHLLKGASNVKEIDKHRDEIVALILNGNVTIHIIHKKPRIKGLWSSIVLCFLVNMNHTF